jgi:RHS repeat-associated protein
VTSALSTYNYTGYDAMGRVKASSQAADGQPVYTMSYDYDLAGNMTSQIYPSGRVLKTEYDQAGRIAGVRNSGSFYYAGGASSDTTNRIGYTAHGSPGDVRLGNGLWEHTNFNNRLQAYEIGLGTSKGLSDTLKLTYDYDTTDSNGNPAGRNNGNVRRQVINVPGAIGVPDVTLTQMYKYDSLNRLSDAQEVSGSTTTQWQVSSLWQQSYSYDLYGNRTAVASTVGTGQPSLSSIAPEIDSTSNRFKATNSSGQATDYDYDEAGNLKQERVPVSGGTALNTYVYDAENKLLQVSRGNVPQDSYAYDGNGQRIKRTVGNTVTIYVYNIMGQLVAEYSNAQPQQNGTSFVTTDALGSARVVTDISQRVLARYDYLPYGEQMPAGMSGRSASQGYGLETLTQKFTGKEHDYETGLDYFGARYYASIQGRFTSPDPLMASARALNPQSWNRYTYVLNNPLRYVDPFGLQESAEEKKNREEAVKMAQAEADAAGLTREIVVSYAYLFGGGLNSIFRRGGPSTLFLLQLPEPPSDDADDTSSETNSEQDEKKKEELDRIEGIEPIIPAEPSANIPDTSAKAEKVLDEILMQQTPHLDGTTLPEMATDAINRVARFEGTAAQKADLYESFTMQITHRTGGSFGAIRNRGTDGSHIFIGNGGELLVITPQGALYRGSISTGGATPGTIMGTFVPHYNNLRLRTAK